MYAHIDSEHHEPLAVAICVPYNSQRVPLDRDADYWRGIMRNAETVRPFVEYLLEVGPGSRRPGGYDFEDVIAENFFFHVTYRQADAAIRNLPVIVTVCIGAWFPEKEIDGCHLLPENMVALPIDNELGLELPRQNIVRRAVEMAGIDAQHITCV